MSAIGLPEVVILLFIGLLIAGPRMIPARLRVRGSALVDPSFAAVLAPAVVSGPYATADRRYARFPTAGAMAELFGLGSDGVRWRQIAIIVTGVWMSDNAGYLWYRGDLPVTGFSSALLLVAQPALFVFATITALRSFQSVVATAVAGAGFNAVLLTSLQVAVSASALQDGWPKSAAATFATTWFTLTALQYTVHGLHVWWRMAGALFVASILGSFVVQSIYFAPFSVDTLVGIVSYSYPAHAAFAVILTGALWLGSRLALLEGGVWRTTTDVVERAKPRERTDRIGAARFLPVAVMLVAPAIVGSVVDLPLVDVLSGASATGIITGFVLPVAAVALVAVGSRARRRRRVVLWFALGSLLLPVWSVYQIETAIQLTGSASIGAVAGGLSEFLLGVPFVLAALLALAVIMVRPQSAHRMRTLALLTVVVTATIAVDLIVMLDFASTASTGIEDGSLLPQLLAWFGTLAN